MRKLKPSRPIGVFLRRFVPLALLVVVGTVLLVWTRDARLEQEVAADESGAVLVQAERIRSRMATAIGEARHVTDLAYLHTQPGRNLVSLRATMPEEFSAFIRGHSEFDQLSLLDTEGMEVVRVDRVGEGVRSVPSDSLQDHADYPHLEGASRDPTAVSISLGDPSVLPTAADGSASEHLYLTGVISNATGADPVGFILLRIPLRPFLEELRAGYSSHHGEFLILTDTGEWLIGLEDVEGARLALLRSLQRILEDEGGDEGSPDANQIRTPAGLATFARVDLAAGSLRAAGRARAAASLERWTVVSVVSADDFRAPGRWQVYLMALAILLALGELTWRWARVSSDREAASMMLRMREQLLDTATNAIRDGFIVADSSGAVTLWNLNAERIFGYTREEMLGKDLHSVLTPHEYREAAAAGLEGFRKTGQGGAVGQTLELSGLRKDGSTFPMDLALSAFQMEGEHFAVGVVRDIIERKGAEEELAEKAHQLGERIKELDCLYGFARIVETPDISPEGVFQATADLIPPSWQHPEDTCARLLIEGEEYRTENFVDTQWKQTSDVVVFGRTVGSIDVHYLTEKPEAGEGPFLIEERSLLGSLAERLGEVLERMEAEAKLALSDEILRSVRDLVLVANEDGDMTFASRSSEVLLGHPPEELLGDGWWELSYPDPEDRARAKEAEARRARGEDPISEVSYDRFILRKDGGELWLRWRESSGPGNTLVGIGSDVTEQKEAEEELIDAVHRAESGSRAKQRFVANMSHEIRTPLNAIIGMADLLWESTLTPDQRDYVQVFRIAGENLLTLINDILDLTKVDEGQLELEKIGFDLRDVVEGVVEVFGAPAHRKGLEIGARIDSTLPEWVLGDPGRLRQIISNLVGNALKFTEQGEILVQVEPLGSGSVAIGEDRVGLHFQVKDTGVGIPAEKVESVFDRFTQADSSTTRRYGGSGLGLTICVNLVELMGGELWVESEEGKGSVFHFTVMLGATEPPPKEQFEGGDLSGIRVLIVDDNATNRLILREILTSWGMGVSEVPGGGAALRALRDAGAGDSAYDLVLLDAEMPDMDGFQVAREICADEALEGIQVIMLTSHGELDGGWEQRELGLAGHMLKPVRRPSLLHTIDAAMRDVGTPPPTYAAAAGGPAAGSEPAQAQLKVLVVDDSQDNRTLIRAYLKKAIHETEYAEHGEEAVERVTSAGDFDLVLMDMQMPIMDGYDATRAIRSWEVEMERPPVRILALSAYAMDEEIEKSLAAGCDGHLTKPIKKAAFLDSLRRVAEEVWKERESGMKPSHT